MAVFRPILIRGDPFRLTRAEQEAFDLQREYMAWRHARGLMSSCLDEIDREWEKRDARAEAERDRADCDES